VFDGDGQPVPDCMLEICRPMRRAAFSDPKDKRALPNSAFRGFGRCGNDGNGDYSFDTIRPGPVPDPDGRAQAPHILLAVFGRGMLMHLYTRIYLGGEAANAADPVLALVPTERRATLIAERQPGRRQRGLPFRHPPAGRQRDGIFRGVTFFRHCEPTGRRNAPPDDRLLEAIHSAKSAGPLDCFVAALLAMTELTLGNHNSTRSPHGRAPSAACAARPWWNRS